MAQNLHKATILHTFGVQVGTVGLRAHSTKLEYVNRVNEQP